MVDAGAALPAEPRRSAHQAPVVASVPLATVHDRLETYLAQSAALDLFAPPQDLLWLRCWIEETRPDTILVTVAEDGQTVLAIALQVTRKGPFKLARIAGLTHANANFFRLSSATEPAQDDARMRAAVRAIRAARKDIHALVLERLAPVLRGRANPALTLPSHVNPNIALSVDLRPGFDVVVDYGNGQRKRKRRRYQVRRLEA
ncbi:GNAT family N-acetyltransferase, partial [Salmonella enterica subsp. enterica serovar Virchow]|nr:GNAT family N-acetyltransferase [Salmonella enterica subsp. enterica serovar Virchow]